LFSPLNGLHGFVFDSAIAIVDGPHLAVLRANFAAGFPVQFSCAPYGLSELALEMCPSSNILDAVRIGVIVI
jgi:hypothetical protein